MCFSGSNSSTTDGLGFNVLRAIPPRVCFSGSKSSTTEGLFQWL